jgi:hypothetical protein
MNKSTFLVALLLSLFLISCGRGDDSIPGRPTVPPGVVAVEVVYLNHPPVRPVLAEVDNLLTTYGEQVNVAHYDFDTPEGEAFAEARKLTEHTPLAIFIDGSMEFTVNGRAVKFYSFPQGQGTGIVPDGAWTVEDLRQVLDQVTKERSS